MAAREPIASSRNQLHIRSSIEWDSKVMMSVTWLCWLRRTVCQHNDRPINKSSHVKVIVAHNSNAVAGSTLSALSLAAFITMLYLEIIWPMNKWWVVHTDVTSYLVSIHGVPVRARVACGAKYEWHLYTTDYEWRYLFILYTNLYIKCSFGELHLTSLCSFY